MLIILIIIFIITILLVTCLIRAIRLKPTEAIHTKLDVKTDENSNGYAEKLGTMIRCETISNAKDLSIEKFLKFHRVLEELFPEIHKTCENYDFNGSLLFKWTGSEKKDPIMFMSHFDVVEATGKWERDPFSGEVFDNKVWGRGAVDTKGNLFCIMQSIEELIKEGYQPEQDIYIASSCTEEIAGEGAALTAQYLKDNGIKLKFVMDEGGMIMEKPFAGLEGTYGLVGMMEKGYGDLKFIARGKGGHSSSPPRNTPIARLAAFVNEAENRQLFKVHLNVTTEEMFRRLTPNIKFSIKFILVNLWLFKPLFLKIIPNVSDALAAMTKTTLTFTMAQGSDGRNVIPQEAFIIGNLRFSSHQSTQESIQIMRELAQKYEIETEVLTTYDPSPEGSYANRSFKLLEETMKEIYPGVDVVPYAMTGGTDCKFYTEVTDTIFRFAPLYINQQQYSSIHGLNENIDIAALSKGVTFYKLLINKY